MPPGAEAALKAKIGQAFETDDCIGAPPPSGDLVLPAMHIDKSCRYDEASASKGRMRLKAHCGDAAAGFEADFTANGRYAPSELDMTVETATRTDRVGYSVHLTMTIRGRRVGACPAA